MKTVTRNISLLLLGIIMLVSFTTYLKAQSAWQESIEKTFAQKRSGQFQAKDKAGKPIILEWLKTNVHEPVYVQKIHATADLLVRAFLPVDMRFIKAHPEEILADKGNPLYPLFKNAVESIDWTLVEEKQSTAIRSGWWLKNAEDVVMRELANTIIFFVEAKDPATNKSLGFIGCGINADDPQGAVAVEPLAIAPEEQQRGLGKLLLSSIFKIIPGVTYVRLGTNKTNHVAIAAYTALGFTQRPAYPSDPKNTKVIMEYRIEQSNILQKATSGLI